MARALMFSLIACMCWVLLAGAIRACTEASIRYQAEQSR